MKMYLRNVEPITRAFRGSKAIFSSVFLIACMAIGFSNNAAATTGIPVAITTCACQNQAALLTTATSYINQWVNKTPPGYVGILAASAGPRGTIAPTVVLVVSTSIPISGTFFLSLSGVKAISATTDAQAVSSDNLLMARAAAETGPIRLPANLPLTGGSDPIELTEAYLSATGLPQIGVPSYSLWHGILTLNLPAVQQCTFLNLTTGKTFTIWSGDVVTVTDANGYTAQFQYNPGAPSKWTFVQNSIRDPKGNPIAGTTPAPTPGGSVQPIGPINVALPGLSPIYVSPWYNNTTPGGTVTVGDPIDIPVPVIQCPDIFCTGG